LLELGVEHTRINETITDDEVLPFGSGLKAIFTPGHAPGHLCFFDVASASLLAGDMVASIGTIIIAPEDYGDMGAYLDSLERMRTFSAKALMPAHGPVLFDAAVDEKLLYYLTHRREREGRILAALTATPQSLEALVPRAYPEISPKIYFLAERSLLAHLQKLEKEGKALRDGEDWRKP
jgi:glyoxylase-like metal-dependent hydrolase (beta-lactamase superfamily II)